MQITPAGFQFPTGKTTGILTPEATFAFSQRATQREAAGFRQQKARNALLAVERFALEKGFTVLSRTLLGDVLEEQGLQLSATFDEATVQRIGKLAGAEYLTVASADYKDIGFYQGSNYYSYRFTLRLIRVDTGQIACTVTWSGRKRFGSRREPDE